MKSGNKNAGANRQEAVHSHRVSIGGEAISLRSDQPEEVVEKLADYLDGKIRDVGGGIHIDKFRILALAAMSVAGDLFELQAKLEENDKTRQDMLAQAKTLNESLDRALAPSD